MTKAVNVRNADSTAAQVVVEVWDQGTNGSPATMAAAYLLPNPNDMTQPYITSTRYLVIREATAEDLAKSIDNWGTAPQPLGQA